MPWTVKECSRDTMVKLRNVFCGNERNNSLTFFSRAYSKSLRTLSPVITPAYTGGDQSASRRHTATQGGGDLSSQIAPPDALRIGGAAVELVRKLLLTGI
jgi:hypothetical protein